MLVLYEWKKWNDYYEKPLTEEQPHFINQDEPSGKTTVTLGEVKTKIKQIQNKKQQV